METPVAIETISRIPNAVTPGCIRSRVVYGKKVRDRSFLSAQTFTLTLTLTHHTRAHTRAHVHTHAERKRARERGRGTLK